VERGWVAHHLPLAFLVSEPIADLDALAPGVSAGSSGRVRSVTCHRFS
jgi:hypothetical protein